MGKRRHENVRHVPKQQTNKLRWTNEQLKKLSEIVNQYPNHTWKEKTILFNKTCKTNRTQISLESQNHEMNKKQKKLDSYDDKSLESVDISQMQNKVERERMENFTYMHSKKIPCYSSEMYKQFCMEYKYTVEIKDGNIDAPQELENAARSFMKFMTGENIEDKRGKYQKETTPGGDVVGETFVGQCKYHSDGVAGEHIRKFYGTVVDSKKKLYFFANSYKNIQQTYEVNIRNIHLFQIFNEISGSKLFWRFRPVELEDIIK